MCSLITRQYNWDNTRSNTTNGKEDNESMKHKIQCILASLLAVWLLTCPALATSFPDVDDYLEYAVAVDYVSELGIMVGDDQGNFNPYKTVTRAEMATIICRMLNETENLPSSTTFTDVPTSHWANAYVGKAAELGIVNGYGNGKFGPSDPVTYEQAVTMVVRALGGSGFAEALGGYPNGYLMVADRNDCLRGISLQVGEPMSRADVAILICNFYSD